MRPQGVQSRESRTSRLRKAAWWAENATAALTMVCHQLRMEETIAESLELEVHAALLRDVRAELEMHVRQVASEMRRLEQMRVSLLPSPRK